LPNKLRRKPTPPEREREPGAAQRARPRLRRRDYIQRSRGRHKAEIARLEWLRLRAEAASLLSRTEESFARAQRNEALAGRVEMQPNWPERDEYIASLRDSASKFREFGQKLWTQAYARDRDLRSHPGAPAEAELRQAPADAVLRLEMIEAGFGICLLLHYGTRSDPRYVLIDSGDPSALRNGLEPRFQALRAGSNKRRLALELALVTHGHYDRWGGLWRLLAELARSRTRPIEVRRLWFNNVVPIGVKGSKTERRRADELVLTARRLGIPINRPFDHFVMPSEIGPARVLFDGGLSATVVAPSRQNIERLVGIARATARRAEGDPSDVTRGSARRSPVGGLLKSRNHAAACPARPAPGADPSGLRRIGAYQRHQSRHHVRGDWPTLAVPGRCPRRRHSLWTSGGGLFDRGRTAAPGLHGASQLRKRLESVRPVPEHCDGGSLRRAGYAEIYAPEARSRMQAREGARQRTVHLARRAWRGR
jgi:hypothetical protein